jgi:hypothetical protein
LSSELPSFVSSLKYMIQFHIYKYGFLASSEQVA